MNRQISQIRSLLDAWDILLRFRWRFVIPAFLVTIAVLAASLMLPRKYEAEAIFERRTDMVLNEIMQRGGSPIMQRHQQSLNQQLAGSPAVDKLLKQLQPVIATKAIQNAGHVDPQQLRSELERLVIVRYDISSSTLDRVRVNYVAQNPMVARMVVNGLVTNYIEATRQEINDKLAESARFFEMEVERCRKSIEEIENQQLTYEIEHGSLLPDSPNNVQLALLEAQAQLTEARTRLEGATLRVKALEDSFAHTDKVTPSIITERNPEVLQLEQRMRELRKSEAQFVNEFKMKEKHPDLVSLRMDIDQLAKTISQLPANVVTQERLDNNPQYSQMNLMLTQARVEKEAFAATVKTAEQKVAALESRSQDFFPVRAEYRRISRDVEQHQRQLAFWEDNLRRVRMAMTAESGNRGILLDFIKPCDPILLPVSPNLIQVLMAAIMLGIIAGSISVLMAYRADESFQEGEDLAREFDLPLMGAVSELISHKQRRLRQIKRMIVYPINAVVMASIILALVGTVYLSLRSPRKFNLELPEEVKAMHLQPAPQVTASNALSMAHEDRQED